MTQTKITLTYLDSPQGKQQIVTADLYQTTKGQLIVYREPEGSLVDVSFWSKHVHIRRNGTWKTEVILKHQGPGLIRIDDPEQGLLQLKLTDTQAIIEEDRLIFAYRIKDTEQRIRMIYEWQLRTDKKESL